MEVAFWQGLEGEDLIVLGLNRGESEEIVERFVDQNEITFPVLVDAGRAASSYDPPRGIGYWTIIREVIVDAEGRIAYFATSYHPRAVTRWLAPPTATPNLP